VACRNDNKDSRATNFAQDGARRHVPECESGAAGRAKPDELGSGANLKAAVEPPRKNTPPGSKHTVSRLSRTLGDEHPGRELIYQACLHYLRMRRAMLPACSESCSRLLTSLATEWRDRFGCSFQMASASSCHRRHRAVLVADAREVACLLHCGGLVMAVHVKSNQRTPKKLPRFPDADNDR
jgi:hypothetical protein